MRRTAILVASLLLLLPTLAGAGALTFQLDD